MMDGPFKYRAATIFSGVVALVAASTVTAMVAGPLLAVALPMQAAFIGTQVLSLTAGFLAFSPGAKYGDKLYHEGFSLPKFTKKEKQWNPVQAQQKPGIFKRLKMKFNSKANDNIKTSAPKNDNVHEIPKKMNHKFKK